MAEKLQGYVKKVYTFYVPTQIGDKFLNKTDYDFEETKKGDKFIVEEKDANNSNH